mmetsp:Transcript_10089/g.13751  ORF Transcript_10089/g.13751 Transcript_10089/m.13751 type:complete len:130 (+) Transcript_10089:233-622(+)
MIFKQAGRACDQLRTSNVHLLLLGMFLAWQDAVHVCDIKSLKRLNYVLNAETGKANGRLYKTKLFGLRFDRILLNNFISFLHKRKCAKQVASIDFAAAVFRGKAEHIAIFVLQTNLSLKFGCNHDVSIW